MQRLPGLQSRWDLFGVPQLLSTAMFEALFLPGSSIGGGFGASTPSVSGCLQGMLFSRLILTGELILPSSTSTLFPRRWFRLTEVFSIYNNSVSRTYPLIKTKELERNEINPPLK